MDNTMDIKKVFAMRDAILQDDPVRELNRLFHTQFERIERVQINGFPYTAIIGAGGVCVNFRTDEHLRQSEFVSKMIRAGGRSIRVPWDCEAERLEAIFQAIMMKAKGNPIPPC